MKHIKLFKVGAYSAFIFVSLFTISIITYWVKGGLEFRAWVPLFSCLVCFWFIASIAAYDYLTTVDYTMARIGWGFALLSIIILFLEAIVWGADRMILKTVGSESQQTLSELRALFNSLHVMVLWFIGIWYALWGTAFLRMGRKGRFLGIAMILVAFFHGGDYLLYRLNATSTLTEFWHLGSQVFNLVSYSLLGVLLLKDSKVSASYK